VEMLKFWQYFVQFIFWVRIPSSLPFGYRCSSKIVGRSFKDGMEIICTEETGVLLANLSAFVLPFIPTWLGIQQKIIL